MVSACGAANWPASICGWDVSSCASSPRALTGSISIGTGGVTETGMLSTAIDDAGLSETLAAEGFDGWAVAGVTVAAAAGSGNRAAGADSRLVATRASLFVSELLLVSGLLVAGLFAGGVAGADGRTVVSAAGSGSAVGFTTTAGDFGCFAGEGNSGGAMANGFEAPGARAETATFFTGLAGRG